LSIIHFYKSRENVFSLKGLRPFKLPPIFTNFGVERCYLVILIIDLYTGKAGDGSSPSRKIPNLLWYSVF